MAAADAPPRSGSSRAGWWSANLGYDVSFTLPRSCSLPPAFADFYDSRDNLPSRKRQSRRGFSPTEDSVPPGIQWCMPPMPSFIGVTGTTNGRIISVSSCSSTWQW